MSADGRVAVVGRRTVRRNKYEAHLWVVSLEGDRPARARRLTSGSDPRPLAAVLARRADGRVHPARRWQGTRDRHPADRDRPRPHPAAPARRPWRDRRTRVVTGRQPARLRRRRRPATLPRGEDRPRRDEGPAEPRSTPRPADHPHRLALRRRRTPRSLGAPLRRRRPTGRPAAPGHLGRLGRWRDRLEPGRSDGRVHGRSRHRAGPSAENEHLGRRCRRRGRRAARGARRAWRREPARVFAATGAGSPRSGSSSPTRSMTSARTSSSARATAPRSPRALAADLDRPIGSWVDSDLTGWMVDGRTRPVWVGSDTIVAAVTDRGRSHPRAFSVDPATGKGRGVRVVEAGTS